MITPAELKQELSRRQREWDEWTAELKDARADTEGKRVAAAASVLCGFFTVFCLSLGAYAGFMPLWAPAVAAVVYGASAVWLVPSWRHAHRRERALSARYWG